jgi:hypothetical protein
VPRAIILTLSGVVDDFGEEQRIEGEQLLAVHHFLLDFQGENGEVEYEFRRKADDSTVCNGNLTL